MTYNVNDDFSNKSKKDRDWNDIKNNAKDIKNDVKNNLNDLSDKVVDISNNAERKAKGYYNSARDNISDASDSIIKEINDNPLRSTALALGLGFLIAKITRSSRS